MRSESFSGPQSHVSGVVWLESVLCPHPPCCVILSNVQTSCFPGFLTDKKIIVTFSLKAFVRIKQIRFIKHLEQ